MPTYVITSPDGKKYKVTGEGTREDALAHIQSQLKTAPKPPSYADQIKRQLGRTARIGAEAIGALPLLAADAGVGVRNLATGSNYQMPSQMYQEGLDAVGLPRAQGLVEQGVDLAGQMAIGAKVFPNVGIKNQAPKGFETAKGQLAREVIKTGEKHGVPVHYDDIGGDFAKRASVAAENVPVLGTSAGKEAQAKAVTRAIGSVAEKYSVGDDIPELVQKGMQGRLASFRKTAGKLYDKVATLLDGQGTVPTTNFDDALRAELQAQQRLGTAGNKEVVAVLEKYADAPRGSFSLMRELRSQLGSEVSSFYKGGSPIGEKGVGALQAAKRALEQDLNQFADDVGGAGKAAWKKADSFYRSGIVHFKEQGLRQLVQTPEPEKAWRWLVSQDTPSRAARMYKALNGEGRSAVRYGLIKEAMDKAATPNGPISPAKFAGYLERHQNIINTFFKGNELKEIQGFKVLMRHVERSGQYMENPPTGNRLIPLLLGGASVMSPKAAVAAGATAAAIKGLFQTTAGRNALVALSRHDPGSKAAEYISRAIGGMIATQSAKLAGQRQADQE